jgi:hypothetical protein
VVIRLVDVSLDGIELGDDGLETRSGEVGRESGDERRFVVLL